MPELPEVETVARGLAWAQGHTLDRLEIFDSKVWFESEIPAKNFAGKKIREVSRRGKYIIFRFENESAIVQHLRMTGKMLEANSAAIPENIKHVAEKKSGKGLQIRAALEIAGKKIYFYDTRRFGTLTSVKKEEAFFAAKKLAPDPFHDAVRARELFLHKLRNTTKNAKAALLDQSLVAGVGNIYADESLFLEKISPKRLAKKIKDPEALWQKILWIMERSLNYGGTSIVNYVNANGAPGEFAALLNVYGREDEPCKICQTKIKKIDWAGRSTHFCPKCQAK